MPVNLELLRMARRQVGKRHLSKYAFVAAGDPAMGAPPPMDPSMMGGGAPPMDPSMMGGGAPPMDPSMMGGGAPPPPMDPMAAIMPMIQQAVQQAMSANGGGGQLQASGPGLKPKIDINVEIVQIKKMLAKIIDGLGIHVPVSDMVVTPEDLNQIAQGGAGYAAATPDNKSGGGLGQIAPISPVKAAEAWESGSAYGLPADYYTPQVSRRGSVAELATALLMRNNRN